LRGDFRSNDTAISAIELVPGGRANIEPAFFVSSQMRGWPADPHHCLRPRLALSAFTLLALMLFLRVPATLAEPT